MSNAQYHEEILDSNAISPLDGAGQPIPVTIPVVLAPGIKVVYTTRLGGVSTGAVGNCNLGGKVGDPAQTLTNRESLARELGVPISLVKQVHSGVAIDIDKPGYAPNASFGYDASATGAPVEADGQVTARPGIALGMFAADCLPVLMADPIAGVIGAAHCGRRGLERGVIGATIDLMVAKGADPGHIVATLGPRICGDCYEVGDQIADEFDAKFPGTFTLSRFGKPGIDIAHAAFEALAEAGVPMDSLIESRPRVNAATQYLDADEELRQLCAADGEGDPDLTVRMDAIRRSMCTLENPLWYSHRRAALAGKTSEGRMLALIMRE